MNNNNKRRNGKAGRGRPKTSFIKQIIEGIRKTNCKELKIAVMDRDQWRSIEVIEPILGL